MLPNDKTALTAKIKSILPKSKTAWKIVTNASTVVHAIVIVYCIMASPFIHEI